MKKMMFQFQNFVLLQKMSEEYQAKHSTHDRAYRDASDIAKAL